MTSSLPPAIAFLGASGLIGFALSEGLAREGFAVRAVARGFTPAQAASLGAQVMVSGITTIGPAELGTLLTGADVVVNCIGVLQDGSKGGTQDVHVAFVDRLLIAIAAQDRPVLLIQLSIPGQPEDDHTPFSRTKRMAEQAIAAAGQPFVILRPGFVIAPAAYGGSALLRALSALPVGLPAAIGRRPLGVTAVADLTRTVAFLARSWRANTQPWCAVWDIAAPEPTVEAVVEAFRSRLGGPCPRMTLPLWLLRAGARVGDAVARLGWVPPVRTTALRELERGVSCDPASWMNATSFAPTPLGDAIAALPGSVQERWFARLFLLKPLAIGVLALFWIASGLIALTAAFRPAAEILIRHGFPSGPASAITAVSSMVDIAVGIAISVRRTCQPGLWAGIAVSFFYMASALLFTPDMWVEPLGALVKTGPAIVLMLVTLAILDDR